MNKNIEIITPFLWAVNKEYIKAGYIKELTPIPVDYETNEYASLTNDGVMILNKQSEFYPILKQFLPQIMAHTDEELQYCVKQMNRDVLDAYEKLYLNVMEWEMKRRCVRQEFLINHAKPTLREKIKLLWRKAGEKCGNDSNSD